MIGWFKVLVSACSDIALPRLRLQLMVQVTGVWDLTADTIACNQERTRGPRKLVVRTRGGCSSKQRGPPSRHPIRCARSMSVSVPTDARAGCSSRHKSRYVSIAMRGLPESTRSVARASHQLPAGRHGMPRSFVVSNQRERVLDAVMQVVAEHGYARRRIADVVGVAGVSRRTFYDQYANKEDAFLAAYDLVVEQLMGAVAAAYAMPAASWPARIGRGLNGLLRLLADEPALARVCVVEVLAACPAALARRTEAMKRFRTFLDPRADAAVPGGPPSLTAETVVGGVYEVIYSRVVAGRTQELPGLLPELLYTVLVPFVGADVATAESARARERLRERDTSAGWS